mmetsp:Transcript_144606/g.204561  ORF Transcript_144606/g.204561 Transcript_144606/m.204561 type:complete len:163 (-) Transcript_144606:39-527(-)
MYFPVIFVALLRAATALPATSLLQVTVQLQRGSVGELAPGTLEALEAGALNSTITGLAAVPVAPKVLGTAAPGAAHATAGAGNCPGCAPTDAELDMLAQVEENEEDEMVALASQAKVSLLQTGLEHQHGPAKAKDIAHLHASGIEDTDEALALLDAVSELGL